jgi:energy-coupling factor transporter transmembrane protein EcfT
MYNDIAQTPSNVGSGAFLAGFGFIMIIYLAVLVVALIANWKIASKAGYHGAWSLLMLVPIANLVVYLVFAFSEWPLEKMAKGGMSASQPVSSMQSGPSQGAQM